MGMGGKEKEVVVVVLGRGESVGGKDNVAREGAEKECPWCTNGVRCDVEVVVEEAVESDRTRA